MIFLEKYNNKKNIRFSMFKRTIEIFNSRKLKTIVETGTSRGKRKFFFFSKPNWKDGMSTLMFSEFVSTINGELHTCDIDENNIKNAKKFCKKFLSNTNFYVDDSVNFLKNFKKKVDLLYLDSFDGHNIELASKHQLKEIQSSLHILNQNSLILLDDKGAKTVYSLPYLLSKNYKIIFETANQILLSR